MEAKVILVTPAMAQKWLNEKNIQNRSLYQKTVESYAADMKQGLWALNNQGIGFDDERNLIDGQHRLQAVVYSGVTVPMLVIRGLQKNFFDGHLTQETVDQGKSRGAGDVLALTRGLENANLKSALIRAVIKLCTGSNRRVSVGILWEIIKIYEKELNAVVENRSHVKALVFAPAQGAFVFAAKCFMEKTIDFEKQYFSGENLQAGNPINTFRNYMLNRPPNNGGGAFRTVVQENALTCLMHHMTGEPFKRMQHGRQGYDFFSNKQKRVINQVCELFKY